MQTSWAPTTVPFGFVNEYVPVNLVLLTLLIVYVLTAFAYFDGKNERAVHSAVPLLMPGVEDSPYPRDRHTP